MRLLLDTQTFFWAVHPAHPVPPAVRAAIEGSRDLFVSDVSAFEIALKVWLGKFDDARPLVRAWADGLRGIAARALPLTTDHAFAGGSLDWSHRDPFDRLLVAQARVDGLTMVTADRAMLAAPGIDVLPW